MSSRPRRRLWFRFHDANGNEWKVWIVLGRLLLGKLDCAGVTDFKARTISVTARQTELELAETAMHELVHAACGEEPRSDLLREVEETICRSSEKGLTAILVSLGFQFPALPKGVVLKKEAA